MYIISSMLKNKLYLFDKWLSKDRNTLFILLLVATSTIMIQFKPFTFYGIGLLSLICIYIVFVKAKILGGQWKLDKSVYDVPQVEEVIVTTKDFYWDGSLKSYHVQNMTSKPNTVFIEKGTELKIIHLRENDDDWVLMLKKGNGEIIITVNYLESKDYYKTKSQIREDKLKKLLK
jgi:hypothetical protein